MASTKPLTDAISQIVSRANGVVNDPEVRTSVRRLGSDLKGFGGAVVDGWKSATASTPAGAAQPATPPAPEYPPPAAPPAAAYPPPAAPPAPAAYPPAPEQPSTGYAAPVQPPAERPGEPYPPQ